MLFSKNSNNPWNSTGIGNLKTLYKAIEKHDISKDHTLSSLKYKVFGRQNIQTSLDSAHRIGIIKHNETVKENRDIIKRLIDMTIFLITQELAFRGHNEKVDSQNQGNFRELAEFLSVYDSKFNEFLRESSVFTGMSKNIQNDLIDSINYVVSKHIESEIQNSVCFSWQVDETTDISCHSQLSVIFRYTYEGNIKEHFMGFYDVSKGRSAVDLFNLLNDQFAKFNFKEKLVGQTYDGASVMSGDLNGLQSQVKNIAPQALFTHCYGHRLNLVLQDAVGNVQECKIFFATLSGISSFFFQNQLKEQVFLKMSAVVKFREMLKLVGISNHVLLARF